MTIIEKPNFTACCNRCKAILEFTADDVFEAGGSGSGKHPIRRYMAIECPCCRNYIEVWNNNSNK